MSERTVTNQAELDAAIEAGDLPIIQGDGEYRVDRDVEIHVEGSSQPRIDAWGSSQPRIVAWGSSQPRIVAWDSSQPRMKASGSSQVAASGPVEITAGSYVAVTVHDDKVRVLEGTHVIRAPKLTDAEAWCAHHGIEVEDGKARLFKGVDEDFRSEHGAVYTPGTEVACDDWDARPVFGGGLHLSPSPVHTERYCDPDRYLEVEVDVDQLVVIDDYGPHPDKVKTPRCTVLREVDRDGDPIAQEGRS